MVLLAVSAEVSNVSSRRPVPPVLRIVLRLGRDNFSFAVLSRTLSTESKQREERRIGGEVRDPTRALRQPEFA
jgi:hypothetical protein